MKDFNFNQHLSQLLKTDNRLVDNENDLQINILRDFVNNLDVELIDLLLNDEKVREKFFIQIKDVYVFKQNDFIFYLDSKVLDGSYTQYANRIGLASGGKFLTDSTDYVLDFPYKDCVLEGGQSTEEGNDVYFEYDEEVNDYIEKNAKRKEIFYNNIIAKDEIDRLLEPKAFQKVVRYDANGETIPSEFNRNAELNRKRGLPEDTITDNLIIKGNNLLALYSLEKEFKGKIKLIYIDPPYNTEKDSFTYNDRFAHSTWLTFMRNRLIKAFDLLADDGGIFVQADWNEIHYLKVLMDSICGRDNFRNEVVWFYENKFKFQFTKNFNNDTEGILYYSKKSGFQKFKHVRVDVKNKRKQNQVTWDKELKKMVTVKDENGNVVYYQSDDKIVGTLWNIPRINSQSKERLDLVGQKPEQLIKRILEACSEEGDIVLDYHLGTGTTAATAHKMGRQYIGVEQLDYIDTFTKQRLYKIIKNNDPSGITKDINWQGGGSFTYVELAKNNETAKERIDACASLEELVKLLDELNTRYFLDYNVRIKDFKEKVIKEEAFINLSLVRQKELFKRMLDNNQLYVNLSETEDKRYNLSEDAIRLTKDFYQIKN